MFVKLAVTATLRLGKFCSRVLWPAPRAQIRANNKQGVSSCGDC